MRYLWWTDVAEDHYSCPLKVRVYRCFKSCRHLARTSNLPVSRCKLRYHTLLTDFWCIVSFTFFSASPSSAMQLEVTVLQWTLNSCFFIGFNSQSVWNCGGYNCGILPHPSWLTALRKYLYLCWTITSFFSVKNHHFTSCEQLCRREKRQVRNNIHSTNAIVRLIGLVSRKGWRCGQTSLIS